MDARKGQQSPTKLKAAKNKMEKLPAEESHMAAFASRGGLDSSNFYENLDRATREIRRHASTQGESWYGLDQPSDFPFSEGLGGSTADRLPIRAVRDIQIPGEGRFHSSSQIPDFEASMPAQVMEVNPAQGLERGGRVQPDMNASRQSIAGLLLNGARRPGSAIMLPDGPRIGFANVPSNVVSASASMAPPPQPSAVPQPIHQHHPSDEGDNFLARINDVLGPLPSDEHDPMANYLGRTRHPRDR